MRVACVKLRSYQASTLNTEEGPLFFFTLAQFHSHHDDIFSEKPLKLSLYVIQLYRLIQPPRPKHQSLPQCVNLVEYFVLQGWIATGVIGWVTSVD